VLIARCLQVTADVVCHADCLVRITLHLTLIPFASLQLCFLGSLEYALSITSPPLMSLPRSQSSDSTVHLLEAAPRGSHLHGLPRVPWVGKVRTTLFTALWVSFVIVALGLRDNYTYHDDCCICSRHNLFTVFIFTYLCDLHSDKISTFSSAARARTPRSPISLRNPPDSTGYILRFQRLIPALSTIHAPFSFSA
jgi:hypothetical protein